MGQGSGGGRGMGRGMGGGRGRGGGGRGVGRGMGRGGGRGMGRGMGPGGGALADSSPGLQSPSVPQPLPDAAQELDRLKAQARAVEEQLAALHEQIEQIAQDATPHRLVAVVDAGRCSGCGLCIPTCPVGAISVNALATIDVARCTACGQCVAECPQEAITLSKA